MIVEIFTDTAGESRYRIKGDNGEQLVTSEGYSRPTDARRGFQDLIRTIAEASAVTFKDV